jgi:orotate phosphoribosyltransferase
MNTNQERDSDRSLQNFHFKSLRETLSILDCSKFYLYGLIKSGKISPYYFQKDKLGKPKGKPYFNLEEIAQSLSKVSKS